MRYKLQISYDGTNYSGYQKQKNKDTIQERLETVLSQVLKQDITLVASGRTDAGVSAIEQICHFDVSESICEKRVVGYANAILPEDIRVLDMIATNENFHARYSAKRKTYQYLFYTGKEIIPVYDRFATLIGYNINIEDMQSACNCFLGEHDFSSFCATNTSVVDKVRTIYDISITNIDDNLYKLEITGNGFLYNMVRIIMGTLVEVGMGKISAKDIVKIIENKDRKTAGKTISAKGLNLKKVVY